MAQTMRRIEEWSWRESEIGSALTDVDVAAAWVTAAVAIAGFLVAG